MPMATGMIIMAFPRMSPALQENPIKSERLITKSWKETKHLYSPILQDRLSWPCTKSKTWNTNTSQILIPVLGTGVINLSIQVDTTQPSKQTNYDTRKTFCVLCKSLGNLSIKLKDAILNQIQRNKNKIKKKTDIIKIKSKRMRLTKENRKQKRKKGGVVNEPHHGAHALAGNRMPALRLMNRYAFVCDATMSSASHFHLDYSLQLICLILLRLFLFFNRISKCYSLFIFFFFKVTYQFYNFISSFIK